MPLSAEDQALLDEFAKNPSLQQKVLGDDNFQRYLRANAPPSIQAEPRPPSGQVGGVVGAVIGGVVAGPPGAIGGAALGSAAQVGIEAVQSPAHLRPSLSEAARDVAAETFNAGMGEVAGAGIRLLPGGRPNMHLSPKQLPAEVEAARHTLQGTQLHWLPGEATQGAGLTVLQDLSENGLFGSGFFTAFRENRAKATREAVQQVADQIGQLSTPTALSRKIVEHVQGTSRELQDSVIGPLFNTIAHELKTTARQVPHTTLTKAGLPVTTMVEVREGGLLVDVSPIKAKFADRLQKLREGGVTDQASGAAFLEDFSHTDNVIQWEAAYEKLKNLRTQASTLSQQVLGGTGGAKKLPGESVLIALEKELEATLGEALNGYQKNPMLYEVWKAGQSASKYRATTFENDILHGFIKTVERTGGTTALKDFVRETDPQVAGKLFQATLSDLELQNQMRRAYVEYALDSAGGQTAFDPRKFLNTLTGKDQFTRGKADIFLTPAQQQKLTEFARAVEVQQQTHESTGFGQVLMAMKTSGALVKGAQIAAAGLALRGDEGITEDSLEVGAILIGPPVLARLLTNPTTAEFFIQGLRYSGNRGLPQFSRIMRELTRRDEVFARAVQTALSVSGIPAQALGYGAQQTTPQ